MKNILAFFIALASSFSFAESPTLLGGELVSSAGTRLAVGCIEYNQSGSRCQNYALLVAPNKHEGYRPVKFSNVLDFKVSGVNQKVSQEIMNTQKYQDLKKMYGLNLDAHYDFNMGMSLGILVLMPPVGVVLVTLMYGQHLYLGTIDMVQNSLVKNPNLEFIFDSKFVGKEKTISNAQLGDLHSTMQYL